MITKPLSKNVVAALLFVGVVSLSGCASEKKPAAPASTPPAPQPVSLTQIKQELLEAKAQMQVTTDAMNKLQKSSAADAEANYNKFTEDYLKLQAKADAVKARAEDLKAKTTAYYEMWNKQMEVENPELRRKVVQQKADAERIFNTVRSEMELARMSFGSYMSNLKDVGNYLRGNLSPASLSSASDLVAKASGQATEVGTHIDAIVKAADSIIAATGESSTTRPAGAGAAVAK